jgi:hypothetical protein
MDFDVSLRYRKPYFRNRTTFWVIYRFLLSRNYAYNAIKEIRVNGFFLFFHVFRGTDARGKRDDDDDFGFTFKCIELCTSWDAFDGIRTKHLVTRTRMLAIWLAMVFPKKWDYRFKSKSLREWGSMRILHRERNAANEIADVKDGWIMRSAFFKLEMRKGLIFPNGIEMTARSTPNKAMSSREITSTSTKDVLLWKLTTLHLLPNEISIAEIVISKTCTVSLPSRRCGLGSINHEVTIDWFKTINRWLVID